MSALRDAVTRPWTRDDLPAINGLLRETWLDAYSPFIPRADLTSYLEEHYSLEKLAALFADANVTGLVAEVDGAVAGYAKLYDSRADQRFCLHQLYVLPSKQGLGLGHLLMAGAERRALQIGADRIWLGVMLRNTRAVAWYGKMGYTVVETSPFVMGSTTVEHYIGYVPLPLPRSAG
ncbi:MAG TPA: GNAT family N-acetyltransferase [Candidatus Acidoferrum sp.]|nr:GNAT family N-acetyltransferase [Candidatus Acidoferrum sp.]